MYPWGWEALQLRKSLVVRSGLAAITRGSGYSAEISVGSIGDRETLEFHRQFPIPRSASTSPGNPTAAPTKSESLIATWSGTDFPSISMLKIRPSVGIQLSSWFSSTKPGNANDKAIGITMVATMK